MENYLLSTENALKHNNWYASLVLCFVIHDFCSSFEYRSVDGTSLQKKSQMWFEDHLASNYRRPIGPTRQMHVFLSGKDHYALRCSILHSGSFRTNDHNNDEVEDFIFVPPSNNVIHMNELNGKLQLQVDLFVGDVLKAARSWLDGLSQSDRAQLAASMGVVAPL